MQLTMDGALTAVDEKTPAKHAREVPDEVGDGANLMGDVLCVIKECHRDRGLAVFRDDLDDAAIAALADVVTRRLAPRIRGRYIPRWDDREKRDAEVVAAFNGRNREEVMRKFGISRRLLYSILARKRK